MGVQTRIILYEYTQVRADNAAQHAFDRINDLDELLSDYRHDSEINRINAAAGSAPINVHPDTLKILSEARDISKASSGEFDVTIGPLVQLWRNARRTQALPKTNEVDEARNLVDFRALNLDAQQSTVLLMKPGMRIDLGGIGKGFAAQRAVETLRQWGASHCLVALAGDIVVGDPPPDANAWRVTAAPGSTGTEPFVTLLLRNAAISTSGDTEQFIDIGGVRYSHIVDPHTGLGATHTVPVTVIANSGEYADALATACSMMPSAESERMLSRFDDVAAIFHAEVDAAKPPVIFDPDHRLLFTSQTQQTTE
ncbi:MAG TPA: FAD:protein FMN transferase [Phycisphaerales bacterium]|nr:FAD:protein FMN transferase [Phycisphaerales bacterium]